ncbi:MAG: hypothetical protein ABII00_13165 [Elusimicrobiota bacterium]
MKTMIATVSLGLILTAGGPARAEGGADIATIWNELFTGEEQRLLLAVTADPQTDEAFGSGLERVLAAQGDAQGFEQAKWRFQLEWLSKINDFRPKYKKNSKEFQARMAELPKPSLEKAREAIPWFTEMDDRDWGGELLAGFLEKMNPHELGYTLGSLRSWTAEQKKELLDGLAGAKDKYPAKMVVDHVIGQTRRQFGKDFSIAKRDFMPRSKTVRKQLEEIELTLASAKAALEQGGAGSLEDAKQSGGAFDNDAPREEPADAVVVGDTAGDPGSSPSGDLHARLDKIPDPEGAEVPSAGLRHGLTINDMPPPKNDGKPISKPNPIVAAGVGIGSLIFGLIGLLLAPIKAIFGAVAGVFRGGSKAAKSGSQPEPEAA